METNTPVTDQLGWARNEGNSLFPAQNLSHNEVKYQFRKPTSTNRFLPFQILPVFEFIIQFYIPCMMANLKRENSAEGFHRDRTGSEKEARELMIHGMIIIKRK